jgi:hypothetical protein
MGKIVGVLCLLVSAACSFAQPPPSAARQSEAMERSARMLRQLDSLEADLHGETATIETYGELIDRHGQATQVACQVTEAHVREITRLDLAQRQKREEKQRMRKRRSVAMN